MDDLDPSSPRPAMPGLCAPQRDVCFDWMRGHGWPPPHSAGNEDQKGPAPTQFPCSQPPAHPDCPCSSLRLAPAAQLLTRQKGIATGGWGRKRDRLDARLQLGSWVLSTRAGCVPTATADNYSAPTRRHTSTGPGICLSAHFPTRGFMPPSSACLPGATVSKSPTATAPPPATRLLEQSESWGARWASGHTSHALFGKLPRGKEGAASLHEGSRQGSRVDWALSTGERGRVAPGTSVCPLNLPHPAPASSGQEAGHLRV